MASELIAPAVAAHLDALVPDRHPEFLAMEAEARRTDFPIIGPAAGHCCYLIARLIGARHIFELGSGFGYSTAWFARAVAENGGGQVHHVVWDEALSTQAKRHLGGMGFGDIVTYQVSEAVTALRNTAGPFDLIFNDIDKHGYPDALDVAAEKLRVGGVLITDNLLWHGRIFDKSDRSKDTTGIREFTRRITTDPRWSATVIPIRDGVMVARWNGR